MSDRLSEYGYNFQIKVITSLLTDKLFLQQSQDILDPGYFENEANKWLIENIIQYSSQYKTPPSLEALKVKIQDIKDDLLKSEVIDHLKESWKQVESTDLPFIKEKTLDFCKNQEIKKAIIQSVDLLKNGDYENIKRKIDLALRAGADKNIGHEYMLHIEDRYTEAVRHVRATPWDVINELTQGGLGKGELGVFVAGPGAGKSWSLVNIGAHAIRQGLKVIHYTMELNEAYVGLRYDSVLTGIINQNLKYHINEIQQTLNSLKGGLVIKYYPTKSTSVNGLKAHIEKCKMLGFNPDLIIIDYGDLLKGPGNEKRHEEIEIIYEEMRGLAGEYEVPVWTASQANRSSSEVEVIEADKIAQSFGKVMVADFVISLSRKINDKIAGTGRWHLIKNRFGPDGITLPSKINTSNGQIQIFADTSSDGKQAQKQMDGGAEAMRKLLGRKYQEIKGEGFE